MSGETSRRGTAEQESFFEELWRDYWLSQAVPGSVRARGKSRRWKDGMALFAASLKGYELAIQKKLLQKPGF